MAEHPRTLSNPLLKTLRLLAFALCAAFAFVATVPSARAQVAGTLEAFNPNMVGSEVVATAVQPDGKIIIAGYFNTVGGAAHANIARLNADGSVDASFTASTNDTVLSVAVQADGKVMLGGGFTMVNGTARNRIARLNADGSLESTATFNPGIGANDTVWTVAVQADGKLVLGGYFTRINGTTRNRIARLNANGSLESTATFNPGTGANDYVSGVAVQADGKIVLGGHFTTINGTALNRIARLNPNGSVESTATFNPGTGADSAVWSVVVQADGKIVLGGAFITVNGAARNYIARINVNGSLESTATFNPGTGASFSVNSMAVQADGKIVLGGLFTVVNGTARNYIARLHADGSVESTATFDPGTGANDTVTSVAVQADGKIVLGGWFSTVNGTVRNRIARLANDSAPQTVGAPDTTQVLWSRGGSAPEVSQMTFELSTDGGNNWTPLGAGTRVGTTANWQRTGLSLPGSGQLRARGRTTSGYFNASSGLVETVNAFPFNTPLQQWKLTHLGSINAPDDSDTDFDSLRTILEYATGGDPIVAGALPAVSTVADKLTLTFPRNAAATDVTLTVQGSDELSTWTDLASSTAGATMVALVAGVDVAETGSGALRTVEVRDLFLTSDPAHPRRFLRLHAGP